MASTRAAIRYAKAILEIANLKGWLKLLVIWILSLQLYKWKFRIEYFYSKPYFRVEVKENALLEFLQIPA
jgi:F-type H+-transporting ATPase subunit delta